MSKLARFKTLLKDRKESSINDFIRKHPEVLDEKDAAGVSGLLYIAYHHLPGSLETALQQKQHYNLYEAAAMGLLPKVITQIAVHPQQLNTPAPDGFYPLTLACFFGHYAVAEYLIQKGAKVNLPATNPTRVMPLHSAVARNDFALCQLLVQNGADVNAKQTQGVTALHSAAHRGNMEIVRLLVTNGANVQATTEDGKTARSFAEQDEKQEVVDYLKSLG